MIAFRKTNRALLLILLIIAGVALLTQCINEGKPEPEDENTVKAAPSFGEFAGSEACAACHKDIYDKHIHTAHYLTSRPAEAQYIKGSFTPGANDYVFSEKVKVQMQKTDSGFYQVEYKNDTEKVRHRFDIVVGSGANGQSYLFWLGSRIFQLPIFYFTAKNEWANSPGYPGLVIFNRPITSRCLECHSTYFQKTSRPETTWEDFNRDQKIYGIDCEKCHGPGAKHVSFEQQHPNDTTGKYIIKLASFTRQQNLDLCALCHGGRLNKSQPSFSFTAGDKLSDYFTIDSTTQNAPAIDVHGNQYGLLAESKCFLNSQMTCLTCHNVHENERGKPELYSQRCMTCHNTEHNNFCKMSAQIGPNIKKNCIDCHMPVQSSKTILFLEQGGDQPVAASMRSHLIAVYPEETKKLLERIKKTGGISKENK